MEQLATALTHNTTLKHLSVSENMQMTTEGMRRFYENPKSLNHLETLFFQHPRSNLVSCARKIASAIKEGNNVTLGNISYQFTLDPSEQFHLELNKLGRRILYHNDDDFVIRMLPHLLARASKKHSVCFLFFFLRERMDLISRYMAMPHSKTA